PRRTSSFVKGGLSMRFSRWLGVVGCLCLFAIAAQADPTICTFSGAASDTPYAASGNMTGFVFNDGPPGPDANFYRLTFPGQGSTNNIITLDLTAPGPTAHVIGDFDFRIGGTVGTHADGLGVALIPTSVYGTTGPGPGITEEASQGAGDKAV